MSTYGTHGQSAESRAPLSVPEARDALARFRKTLDEDCPAPLREQAHGFNCFEVLRITETEIRHSNMLAWLLDPRGSHGLGSAVLKQLVEYLKVELIPTLDELDSDLASMPEIESFDDFTVSREWSHIDLLVAAKDGSLEIAIENKVRSREHGDQLERYRSIMEQRKARGLSREMRLVYLTPTGEPPSDPEHWIPLSYEAVVGIIERALEGQGAPEEQRAFIGHYLNTVRRHVMPNDALEQACRDLYADHKYAIDLLAQHLPDHTAVIKEWLWEWAERQEGAGGLVFDKDRSRGTLLKFTSEVATRILPPTPGCQSTWGSDFHYYFELDFRNPDFFFMMFVLNGKTRPGESPCDEFDRQLKLFERIETVALASETNEFKRKKGGKEEGWEYRTYCRTLKHLVYDSATKEDVHRALDGMAKEVQESVNKLLSLAPSRQFDA